MANTPPPLPTQSLMLDSTGKVTRVWISWFTAIGQTLGFYQSIQAGGTVLPGQAALNFLPPFIVTDNRTNGSTDISLATSQTVQSTANKVMGVNYQNTTGANIFVSVVAYTPQAVANNSAFALSVGPTEGGQIQVSVGNVTNGPGYGTVSSLVPAGSWYSVNNIYGTYAIVANGWQEFGV